MLGGSIRHECGLLGVYSNENKRLADTVYYGLFALQHRGQESAGISVVHNNKIEYYKNLGLVSEVFDKDRLDSFPEGDIAIGHVRYASSSTRNIANAQPMLFYGSFGRIAIGHNGNLVNGKELREQLIQEGHIFQSATDCEVISALINKYSNGDNIENAILKAVNDLKGGFAIVLSTYNKLIAVRDRSGLMPLVLGRFVDDYIVSSESCAIDVMDGKTIRDVEPGEILVIDSKGLKSYYMNDIKKSSCVFEMVYIARNDSIIDNKSVYQSRFNAGRELAKMYKIDADVVSGAPDSGVLAGRGYAAESGIPYVDILSKNVYIGRSFLQPEQFIRERSIKIKLNVISTNVKGKRIILVDDSIVRGTTCKKTVEMLRNAGAKEIHLMVASPPVRHPCYYGVDMSTYDQLIAANYTIDEMTRMVGADSINYLTADKIVECSGYNGDKGFCTACFTGNYPIKITRED